MMRFDNKLNGLRLYMYDEAAAYGITHNNDCAVRAVAVATNDGYPKVYSHFVQSSPAFASQEFGAPNKVTHDYLEARGFKYKKFKIPTPVNKIKLNKNYNYVMKFPYIRAGLPFKHYIAVIGDVVIDTGEMRYYEKDYSVKKYAPKILEVWSRKEVAK